MMSFALGDTIVAIATAPGVGGVGIIRLSGPRALAITRQVAWRHSRPLTRVPPRRLILARFQDPATGAPLDEGLVALMPAPASYTGEEVVEWQTHGAPLALRRLVELALRLGARQATAGEMTLRAFLHGRIDLSQAEAVADLIAANSDAALRQALGQLAGQLAERVRAARAATLAALTPIEASLDFPEDEVPTPDRAWLAVQIATATAIVTDLLAGAERGRVARDGARCVIIGRPNVGKSSLLNALLRADRAIVTPLAGTTRDTIEETAILGGVACHLTDTAGLAPTEDPVARIGVARGLAALRQAEIALVTLDRSQPLTPADHAALAETRAAGFGPQRPWLAVLNKADLAPAWEAAALGEVPPGGVWPVSALTGAGLADLEAAIAAVALGGADAEQSALVTRARHREALRHAAEALDQAALALREGLPLDLLAEDLRVALAALGAITGDTITEDLLTSIFQEFCIGK